mgnify:CR=1 FL=1
MVSMKPQHQERNAHLPFYPTRTAIAAKYFPYRLKTYDLRSRESSLALNLVQQSVWIARQRNTTPLNHTHPYLKANLVVGIEQAVSP